MQFQVDAGHPWPDGQEWEHIGGIAGANTMAHFDMFDPGGTVSSHVPDETGVAATAARFEESPDHLFMGFDASTSPPSLVVGTTTRRRVKVVREPAGSDVTFEAADPSIATVGTTHEGIVVGGESAGTTTVRAIAGGQVLAELAVTVKDAREHVVNFFFVAGSERDHEKATLLTLRLNRLWRRQANVHFTLGIVQDVDLPEVPARSSRPSTRPRTRRSPSRATSTSSASASGTAPATTRRRPIRLVFLPDQRLSRRHGPRSRGRRVPRRRRRSRRAASGEERRRITKALADAVNP